MESPPIGLAETGPRRHVDPDRAKRAWALAVAAALLAGLTAWLVGQAKDPVFVPPARYVKVMGVTTNIPAFADKLAALRKNASLANATLGAALGFWMGLAGGLSRGAPWPALRAGVIGLAVGAALAGGVSEAVLPYYYRQLDASAEELSRDMTLPLVVHGLTWGAAGAAGGLAFALGFGFARRAGTAILGGLAGGAIGAGLYEMAGALAFPDGATTDPIAPGWGPRLLATLVVSVLSAVVTVFALRTRVSGPAPETVAR